MLTEKNDSLRMQMLLSINQKGKILLFMSAKRSFSKTLSNEYMTQM